MTKKSTTLLLSLFLLSIVTLAQPPYMPTWESLDSHKMPSWYDDAKIGLSMHWGVYSVPAWAPRENGISYAEWYGFRMHEQGNPTVDYHREKYGNATYDDFIPK
ncbi:MAG: alpha-L-fucosidase, partial [Bacteroidales bacterium]